MVNDTQALLSASSPGAKLSTVSVRRSYLFIMLQCLSHHEPVSLLPPPSQATSSTSTLHHPPQRRKLSKQTYPSSVYSAPHLTELRPAFLDSLPELQPSELIAGVNIMTTSSPIGSTPTCEIPNSGNTTRPVFELFDDKDEEEDDERTGHCRTWSAEDIASSSLSRPSLPAPISRHRSSRRWSTAITEIADDREFLRELDYELLAHGGASSIGAHDVQAWSADGSVIGCTCQVASPVEEKDEPIYPQDYLQSSESSCEESAGSTSESGNNLPTSPVSAILPLFYLSYFASQCLT